MGISIIFKSTLHSAIVTKGQGAESRECCIVKWPCMSESGKDEAGWVTCRSFNHIFFFYYFKSSILVRLM